MMPNSRKEFEHNMNLLAESFEKDTVTINITMSETIKGIMAVKYAPNRRVNLHTVNEMARLMANTTANMRYFSESKFKDDNK